MNWNRDCPTLDDQVPLTIALKHGHWSIASQLLDAGAYVDARNSHGRTPLLELAEHDKYHVAVQWLLDYGADIEARDQKNQKSPLQLASGCNCIKVISILGEERRGISPERWLGVHADGRTAELSGNSFSNWQKKDSTLKTEVIVWVISFGLYFAMQRNRCRFYLSWVPDANSKDGEGYTPLELAISRGYQDIVDILSTSDSIHHDYQNDNQVPFQHNRFLGDGSFCQSG